ncbi:MAG: AMP-binding protein [Halioglobus sp.]|nr:AMP-binding protein [Halioglobus sp.]
MTKVPYVRLIRQFAQNTPQRVTLEFEDARVTCLELELRSNRLARAYAQYGVRQGDLVTICLPNAPEYFFACVAAWKLGAVPNPLSAGLPDTERNAIVERADPALIVGVRKPVGQRPTLPPDFEPDPALPDTPLPEKIAPHERALTSGGSTGVPKLIMPGNPAVYDVDNPSPLFTPRNAMLVPGPLYHAGPYSAAWGAVFAGGKAVIMHRFDAARCLQLIEKHCVDRVFFVPTMLNRIWRLPQQVRTRYDLSSLESVVSGGAPCPQWLMRAWIEWLGPQRLCEGYGPSERIGRTFITGEEWLRKPGSVGRAMDGCRIRILDPQGRELPAGEIGEIYMMPATGSGSTFVYRGAERRTTEDGWESVGDMGHLDEDGYLFIADRRTDMIVCGGRNIYPAEIEAALNAHPDVRASVVVGLPDDDLGQRIHAIVECEAPVGDELLRSHLKTQLVPYKWPHSFEYVSEPLFNEAGKVRRSALRAQRVAGCGN